MLLSTILEIQLMLKVASAPCILDTLVACMMATKAKTGKYHFRKLSFTKQINTDNIAKSTFGNQGCVSQEQEITLLDP